jgi:hypothetical protein
MDTPSNDKNAWLRRITLAALTGVVSAAGHASARGHSTTNRPRPSAPAIPAGTDAYPATTATARPDARGHGGPHELIALEQPGIATKRTGVASNVGRVLRDARPSTRAGRAAYHSRRPPPATRRAHPPEPAGLAGAPSSDLAPHPQQHVLISERTALGTQPISKGYFQFHPRRHGVGLDRIRRDRILHEALATGANPLHPAVVFNLSITAASRYATLADQLATGQLETSPPR